jgi:chorismate synthase
MPLRPGHADFTAEKKYHGYQDARGGGHFSGRITAALVAAGAILSDALRKKGILIGSHIKEIACIPDRGFENEKEDILSLGKMNFPVFSEKAGETMKKAILSAAEEGDSVGGMIETCILGLPAGVGEPWFDTLEGMLSHALFSIPAVKGVEFGAGFGFAKMRGSEANDAFYLDESGTIKTKTNHNGGIGGGISNGMPILFSVAVKPTPTIRKEQETVDLKTGKECILSAKGRHDPCIVHRACSVVDAVAAIVIYDVLASRFGTDFFAPEK